MLLGFEIGQRWPEAVMHSCGSYFIPVPKANDWSLTPRRYVGVAPEDGDFEETVRETHVGLEDLNNEAVKLAATIS